jgi:hypothetical protein
VRTLDLRPDDLDRLASIAYVLIDLESLTRVLTRAGAARLECRSTTAGPHIMSARVLYADLATRGFALEDAFPYAAVDERGRFATRAIAMTRDWKRYADAHDFAPLLASETPWIRRSGDILAAVRAVGKGELLATDTPWIAAGAFGPPLAPRLAAQLLRTQLGGAVPDFVQYWNRWDETHIVVRDLLDLARRYAPLQAYRWGTAAGGVARLGLTIPALDGHADCHLTVSTGRIDNHSPGSGLAPESLAIFMKWLAREARERTAWAVRALARRSITLQFDTAAGLRYAHTYPAAPAPGALGAERHVQLRCTPAAGGRNSPGARDLCVPDDTGLFGEGSHDFQKRLTDALTGILGAVR